MGRVEQRLIKVGLEMGSSINCLSQTLKSCFLTTRSPERKGEAETRAHTLRDTQKHTERDAHKERNRMRRRKWEKI